MPGLCIWIFCPIGAETFIRSANEIYWQQTDSKPSFTAFVERERLTNLDRVSRVVFAVQIGKDAWKLDQLTAHWSIRRGGRTVASGTCSMKAGLVDVQFGLAGLQEGRFDIAAELKDGDQVVANANTFFRYEKEELPELSGRIALNLPRGVPLKEGSFPVHCGVPFQKGALWSKGDVRVVKADGSPVPSQTVVRSRWGLNAKTSIRWLGVDFQAEKAAPWWPERKDTRYYLEYGKRVSPAVNQESGTGNKVSVAKEADGFRVDTGPLQFLVRNQGFNLLAEARLNGAPILQSNRQHGLYLIDNEGDVYRAANDLQTALMIEEQGPLRVVLRAEGWYVKDGTEGKKHSYTLPTDRLCKFITRIEAYAGKPYVRVLHSWVLTFDSHTVRLKDVGLSLPLNGASRAVFGVEGGPGIRQPVSDDGVYLIQHLPHAFSIDSGKGRQLSAGRHSEGWVSAVSAHARITVSHRDTWQRFPKEFEVLRDQIRFHIWPAHGRFHPEIDELKSDQIHKLWFAHQGKELNMAQPWDYYFAVANEIKNPSIGVYKGAGLALAGVHSSGLGSAITSDLLIHFSATAEEEKARQVARCFQAAPHALPDTKWLCKSESAGLLHPYDPENMKAAEETIEDMVKGYWETQDKTDEYGMWIYRVWHHNTYFGDGKWQLYRLYNTTHHYELFMPWMLYARSGDPFYLKQGMANIRQMTDVQMIHYDDPKYPHIEFHFGAGRLVGSTRHTNGFNTWGGDHAVLGHLTCYNGIMLAHYLTGDLRLREVVVDEWQKTILTDRANRQFSRADRSSRYVKSGARDVANTLGELIDLYQLTYRSEILALMAPTFDFFVNQHMRLWGQPLHNVLHFYGSEQAKMQLLEAVDAYRRAAGKPDDPKSVFWNHAPHEVFAMASIVSPESNAHVDAWMKADVPYRRQRARDVRAFVPRAVAFCTVPDYVLYLPRVMHAIAEAGGNVSLKQLSMSQPLPIMTRRKLGHWSQIIVREDNDQEFDISFSGSVEEAFPVKVIGPDGKLVTQATIPVGSHAGRSLKVPRDGRTGEYVIFAKPRDPKAKLLAPLTSLPEVYYCDYWAQHSHSLYFIRSKSDAPEQIQLQPHKTPARVYSSDHSELLAVTETGEWLKFKAGPKGVWLNLHSRYAHPRQPIVIAVHPERWFMPGEKSLNRKPENLPKGNP